MPRGDGSGPMGLGSMTGKAAGFCKGSIIPGFDNEVSGFSGSCRRGVRRMNPMFREFRGPFFKNRSLRPENKNFSKLQVLEHQIEVMEESLKITKKRLSELQNQ